jgi:hypothetical protein
MVADQPPEDQESEDSFSIALAFAGAICPTCNEAREPGQCPECGLEIPEVDEVHELAAARQAALTPLARETRSLVESFDSVPPARTELAVDQFIACVLDLDLITRAGEMAQLGPLLSQLDFDDPKAIGGPVRHAVQEYIERARVLRDDVWELASFEAGDPGSEFREFAIEVARWGAEIVDCLLHALTASDPAEVREMASQLQERLSSPPFTGLFDELMPRLSEWSLPDEDARIACVLGKEGRYTDEFGLLDPAAVFGAFADKESPLEELARAASSYFKSVLGPSGPSNEGANALLVLPAVTMATLDRPLLAHRTARLVHDLIERAWARDPDAVQVVVGRTVHQAPIILGASSRIQKSFRLLMLGMGADQVDGETAISTALTAYQELVESAYRMLGWMVLDLDRVVSGARISSTDDAPTVGNLSEQLAASREHAAKQIGAASDSALRNAVAHSRYRWDAEAEEVRDLKTGQSWSVETLERRIDGLVGAVIGADAGWACFVVTRDIEVSASWLEDGSAPEAPGLVATLCFSSHGFKVSGIEDGGATVLIDPPEVIDPARLTPPLAGMSVLPPQPLKYRIKSAADGSVLLEIDAVVMQRAREAEPVVKDLAVLETGLNAMVNSGRDQTEALLETATLEAKVIAVTGLQELATNPDASAALRILRQRLAYLRELVATAPNKKSGLSRLREKLALAEASAAAAARDRGAYERLVDQLQGLTQWANNRGIQWPPRLGFDGADL